MNADTFGTLSLAEVKARLKEEAAGVEAWLGTAASQLAMPRGLREAMEYSLLAGGKRIRPVLCLVSARLFGAPAEAILPFACAIECIHTYSLIHDDLPAMDDDDLRRGRPSCHKQFDEATAILAGDGLLTDAFFYMTGAACAAPAMRATTEGAARTSCAERTLAAVRLAAEAAGSAGMVGGQYFDMQYTAREGVSLAELQSMHAMKTGAMIRMACEAGAVLAGAAPHEAAALRAYGEDIGAAFQITDDILDETGTEEELGKPVGSDAAQEKTTYPSLLGLEKSRELARLRTQKAAEALAPFTSPGFDGQAAELLRGLAAYILHRVS